MTMKETARELQVKDGGKSKEQASLEAKMTMNVSGSLIFLHRIT
jgi:hypothetical protein